jgi:hypothetical protein
MAWRRLTVRGRCVFKRDFNAKRKDRKRGTYQETGEELMLSLLKTSTAITGAEIDAAWRSAGRPGICNYCSV